MIQAQNQIYQQIFDVLHSSKKILITSHERPDGDALGSLLAFYYFLKQRLSASQSNQLVKLYLKGEFSLDFNFLPHFDKIENNERLLGQDKFDTWLILDIGDFSRSGLKDYLAKISYQPRLINIDHHASNDNFGHYNLVDVQASSTAEIIYQFFKYFPLKIEPSMATALLTGIITDTDFFLNPNTTPKCLKSAAELIKAGARLNLILRQVARKFSIKGLRLWGKALARLELDPGHKLATTAIFKDDLAEVAASEDELTGLANFLNTLSETQGIMILKEQEPNLIKGSLRTNRDEVDVAKIAQQYGGGGHAKAAGFKVKGRIVRGENNEWKVEKG